MNDIRRGRFDSIAPALTLAFSAPMFAEVLPGATRFSSIFVFPIEMAVWGGGAVMARALVRSRGLGWWSLLFLGLALSIAEEFLIQQTSVAPMVIRLKGETWARSLDVNYVYLIWALVYESVWVVLMPTLAVELMFRDRHSGPWLNRTGAIVTGVLFSVGCFFAWFTWTQIARTKVFHQPSFTPQLHWVLIAAAAIVLLILTALRTRPEVRPLRTPQPWLLGFLSAIWAVMWFALVVLAFGIAPQLSPAGVVAAALVIILLLLIFVPRWATDAGWRRGHDYAMLVGGLCGSMAVSFVAFQGAAPTDLWFKIVVDLGALIWLIWLGRQVLRRN
jgi:small-conductance mechanosensitive channel